MSLCGLCVSRDLKTASSAGNYLKLPTPFQMSLLIGILVASGEQLRGYLGYVVFRKRRASIPPILHGAAGMMMLTLFLASGVFVADTWLHYTTSTIETFQNLPPTQPYQALGRGLSDLCLTFNRTQIGLPCSIEYGFVVCGPQLLFRAG